MSIAAIAVAFQACAPVNLSFDNFEAKGPG
jgi:hypothetical protein